MAAAGEPARAVRATCGRTPARSCCSWAASSARSASGRSEGSLDWHLLERPEHAGIQSLVRDLNLHYRDEPALWEVDFEPAGFRWLEPNDAAANVLAFVRLSKDGERPARLRLQLLAGAAPGLPGRAAARAAAGASSLNTDSELYGGSGVGNLGGVTAEEKPWHDQPFSAEVTLPPLGVVWLVTRVGSQLLRRRSTKNDAERSGERRDDTQRPDLQPTSTTRPAAVSGFLSWDEIVSS